MSIAPRILRFDDIDWVDETANPDAPAELVAKAQQLGARRKHVARGDGGFWCQYTTLPAGYHVPPHSHDQNELLVVLSGGCRVWPDGAGGPSENLGPRDSVILAANHEYSFTCGAEGMEFFVLRPGDSTASFDQP
ncbi:cupin domain-containing protein [Candidatus Poriferisocius sp.]|uniref:cupin domain-containing protein n=1 Tax=Candidatus Poriferisocius sp. TaxID=3101276 RepID=UPI003B014C48